MGRFVAIRRKILLHKQAAANKRVMMQMIQSQAPNRGLFGPGI